MANFCPFCGGALGDGAAFCGHCGRSLPAVPAADPVPAAAQRRSHWQTSPQGAQTPPVGATPLRSAPVSQTPSQAPDAYFCPFCGGALGAGAAFCGHCGNVLPGPGAANVPYGGDMPAGQTMPRSIPESTFAAASGAGETASGVFDVRTGPIQGAASRIFGPVRTFFSGFGGLFRGMFSLFGKKNVKALPVALGLIVLWAALYFLRREGIDSGVTRALTFLFGGRGAAGRSWLGALGGMAGQGTVAAALASLICGGRSVGAGAKRLFRGEHFRMNSVGPLLMGMGGALCVFQAFAGHTPLAAVMTAVSGAVVALRALGGRNGGLYRFARSLTAGKTGNVRRGQPARTGALLAGVTLGFVPAVPVSALLGVTGSLIAGGAVLLIGIILTIAGRNAGRTAAGMAVLCLLFSLFLPALYTPAYAAVSGEAVDSIWVDPWAYFQTDNIMDLWPSLRRARPTKLEVTPVCYDNNDRRLLDFTNQSTFIIDLYGDTPATYETRMNGRYDYSCYDLKATFIGDRYDVLTINVESVWYYNGEVDEVNSEEDVIIFNASLDPYAPFADKAIIFETTTPDTLALVIERIYFSPEEGAPPSDAEEVTNDADTNPGETSVGVSESIVEGNSDAGGSAGNHESSSPEGSSGNTGSSADTGRSGPSDGTAAALSGGAALLGAGAAGLASGEAGESEEERRRRQYRMYVYKNFGDAIRRGANPVQVYARMGEIINGVSYDRPDLTARITVSASGLDAWSAGMENNYLCAMTAVPRESQAQTGTLTFTFNGEGGTFRNNIVFRIAGDPRMVFGAERSEDGGAWIESEDPHIDMIAGTNGRDSLRIVLFDAVEEPQDIRFRNTDGFSVTAVKDTQFAFTYYADVVNRTPPMEKESDIFGEKEVREITAEAVFRDGLTVTGTFAVRLWPEGLTVRPTREDGIQNGRLIVETAPIESRVSVGTEVIPVTRFYLSLAYLNGEGKAVVQETPPFQFSQPTDDARYGELFENFSCELERWNNAGVAIRPEQTLPVLNAPYEAHMLLSVRSDGQLFREELPLAFTGDMPRKPSSAEWETAFNRLKRSIKFYGMTNDPQIRAIVRTARDHSAAELEKVRGLLILAAMDFYREERDAYRKMSDLCTRYIVVAGTLVKCGDYAVEFILSRYWPAGGETAAAVVNPLKNLMATYVGTYIANGDLDKAPNFFNVLLQGCQDALGGVLTGEEKPTARVLGYIAAAYIMVSFAKHYQYGERGEKGDVYRSLIAAFGDLAFDKFKEWLTNWLKTASQKIMQGIGNLCGNIYKRMAADGMRQAISRAGTNAFDSSVRQSIRMEGGLSTAAYNAARWARSAALQAETAFQEDLVNGTAARISDVVSGGLNAAGKFVMDSAAVGAILNYLAGGTQSDNEALGLTTEQVIWGYLQDRLGLKVARIWDAALDPRNVTFRIESGGVLVLGMLGYEAAIPIGENMLTLIDVAFSFCTAWMDDIWEHPIPAENPGRDQDLRDRMETDTAVIEEQCERLRNLKPIEYRYTGA